MLELTDVSQKPLIPAPSDVNNLRRFVLLLKLAKMFLM
jgi:hypothetical protein